MKTDSKVKLKTFKLIGRDPRKRKLELSFEQRAQRRELQEEDRKKINTTKIRRISIDSVYDPNHYRILVAEFKEGAPIEEILHTKSWETEYSILKDGKEIIHEKDDPLLEGIPLRKSQIDEGRVFLFNDGYISEITKYAKEDAKETYKRVLGRRRRK